MSSLESFPLVLAMALLLVAVLAVRYALRSIGRLVTSGLLVGLALGAAGTAAVVSLL